MSYISQNETGSVDEGQICTRADRPGRKCCAFTTDNLVTAARRPGLRRVPQRPQSHRPRLPPALETAFAGHFSARKLCSRSRTGRRSGIRWGRSGMSSPRIVGPLAGLCSCSGSTQPASADWAHLLNQFLGPQEAATQPAPARWRQGAAQP